MKIRFASCALPIIVAALLLLGWSQSAPLAATPPPVAAPVAQPAAAPAKKVDFPAKGKTITLIVPFPAGGQTGNIGLSLVPSLEKILGTKIVVEYKPGAGVQVGSTALALARPDGYTIGIVNLPTIVGIYLDSQRQAVFTRQSFIPIGSQSEMPSAVTVPTASKYKTLKELVDDAKARPGGIKASTPATTAHMALLQFSKAAGGMEFTVVKFEGGGQAINAMLGGHVDVVWTGVGDVLPMVKGGQARVLAVTSKYQYLPDVRTFRDSGHDVTLGTDTGYALPAGTPREVVEVMRAALKKAMTEPDLLASMDKIGAMPKYLSGEEMEELWRKQDTDLIPLLEATGVTIKR
jgi:tripartite-type tricarboxylate transporter receptor subunit TctC